jgi:hypothetical protein
MTNRTPFLSAFRRLLFGRKSVTEEEKILRMRAATDQLCATQLRTLFGQWLPLDLLHEKSKSGTNSRHSVFTPAVTFWAFLGQILDPGSSCEKAVARVQVLCSLLGRALPSSATGAYCLARARLSVRWLCRLCAHVAEGLMTGQGAGRLLVADGTGVSLPDTETLQARYPQSGAQQAGCGFPHMKLLGLFDLRSGAWLATIHSTLRIHDLPLLRRLFHRLRRGDTLIVDRAFCSWFDLARLQAKGVDLVVRLHQARRADFRTGVRFGRGDHGVIWPKPQRPSWMDAQNYAALPAMIIVREVRSRRVQKGFRTTELVLVTTLLDANTYSQAAIADLYARRWRVELFFDDIKTTLQMDRLRTKSPAMVQRELLLHMIAYNLLRRLMVRSGGPVERMSFKGTVDRLQTWAWVIWSAPNARRAELCVDHLLETIAATKVPCRPGRHEPRAVKRRPKSYQLLTRQRHLFQEVPHRA